MCVARKEVEMKKITKMLIVLAMMGPLTACGQTNSTSGVNIHLAALQGDVESIRQHIEAESDLNEKDSWGSTPLIIAATFDKVEVARALIAAGADMHLTNNDGATALHSAAFLCNVEIVEELLKNGADRQLKNAFGRTPLESVEAPFDDVKDIYDGFAQALAPLGLELDYDEIRSARPVIAEMLRNPTEN